MANFENSKINFVTSNSEKHGNLFCGKCDGKQQKCQIPIFVFVRAQKDKSCEKGNIDKRQIFKNGKINFRTRNSEKHGNIFSWK